jgi:hypothetical protein
MSNLAGRQVFEFGLARELRRIKHQGHRVIKRKLKSADGPGAHAARLTHGANNLNARRPAQFNYKVEQSNKRLKKRGVLHHEHAKKSRVVAKWKNKQAAKKRRGLDAITANAKEANRKANEAFASAAESIELSTLHSPNPNKGTLTREQVRLRMKVPPRPQDKVQEIFISKLHAIRYKMPEAKNRGNLAKRKYLKAKK